MKNTQEFIKKAVTPFYLYEKRKMLTKIEEIRDMFPTADILYSIKTNPFPEVVKLMAENGIGADAASLNEVFLAHRSGISSKDIFYSAPGKTKQDIIGAIGKCTIIADSYHELKLIGEIAKGQNILINVGLRINPDFSMFDNKRTSSKFGVDIESIPENLKLIKNLSNIEITGIHVHIRSQVLNTPTLIKYYNNVYELAGRMQKDLDFTLKFINFGGGVGTVYSRIVEKPLDSQLLSKEFVKLSHRNGKGLGARLMIESGRFLTCTSGSYITEIVDIKVSRGKKYLIVKNVLNGFIRPSIKEMIKDFPGANSFFAEPLFTSLYAFDIKILTEEKLQEKVDVVGHLCTSIDVLASDILLQKAKIGDRVIVSNAGSYAYTLSPILLSSQDIPKEYLV